ncbi:MAG: prepilin peptidase [Clostridia bacterium]|jgi:prepilin peptidase CpaA|nr:prepilin peptidase [Clostridia bacterium]
MRALEMINSTWFMELLLLGILIICCYTDLKERKILNTVVLPAMVVALFLQFIQKGGTGILSWALGTLAGIALLFIPFALGGIGAGDVKLLGVIGSFKGAAFAFKVFLIAAIIGGIISFILLLKEKRLRQSLVNIGMALKVFLLSCFRIFNLNKLDQENVVAIPYGIAIALGAIVCLAGGWLC